MSDLLDLISPKEYLKVLDFGCGSGTLSKDLFNKGYDVIGVDSSLDELKLFERKNPNIPYYKMDLLNLKFIDEFDLIMSNNYLHKVLKKDQHQLAIRLNKALKINGELILEFDGFGSCKTIHETLNQIFNEYGLLYKNDFYNPTIREHANVLEDHGFLIKYAELINKNIKIECSLREWILMYDYQPFNITTEDLKNEIIAEAAQRLKNKIYHDSAWYIDCVKIIIKAYKFKNI